ncbi:isoprenylcysteine carboxyl methyltransferase [Alkaliphilus metalliredigens QYMF]|uniref:Isoprenylcysteine carboxyl methyltransferase n=1 Tax=Alkaliphilus metalliredigens (strain QYMF) TaxID=293826 RepID=A6TT81_ALKMQ|nr:isoprenylcysteine carboxylmethyltransferase family protein [Alkaliphilus metalliredigens]ABR49399.1 isoprenylcysteine carboxyl methyltransferase [Alkaliphilus metalliredigens QYMF]
MHFLDQYAYGLWGSVLFNIVMFGGFVYLAFRPQTKRDWRTLGAFTSFMVALFAEMFGFPLTIYILTSVLGNRYPVLDPFTHLNGHLWVAFAGGSQSVYAILHPLSNIFIFAGLMIIVVGWRGIHGGNGELVTGGIYRLVRHPQYSGFMVMILGFLIQWPTIITLVMAPSLLIMYSRLAKKEEKVMITEFGEAYLQYRERVPAFIPKMRTKVSEEQI